MNAMTLTDKGYAALAFLVLIVLFSAFWPLQTIAFVLGIIALCIT
jgi:hypothetical protein